MTSKTVLFAALVTVCASALASCTTTGGSGGSIASRWVGKPAGEFFARFGPPTSDANQGSTTVYSWRGGYKSIVIPAKYAEGSDGKKGKLIAPARSESASCSARIETGDDYIIRSISLIGDRGEDANSYCNQYLNSNGNRK